MSTVPKLSDKEATIMALLIDASESYGLDLVERSGGRLKRGTVYVTLDRMEDKGYIESWKEEAPDGAKGPPRRLYKPTGYGVKAFSLWERLAEVKRSWAANPSASPKIVLGGAR